MWRVFNGGWNTGRDVPDALHRLLTIQRGVVSRAQVDTHLSRASLRHLLKSGRWRSVHRAVFVAHNGAPTDEQRLWVASLAAGGGSPALLGGRTALAALGLKGFATDTVHVLLCGARRVLNPPKGTMLHRTSALTDGDIYRAARPPCTTVARSVVDAASWARSDDEARTVIAMVFQQRMTTLGEITAVLDRMPRARRRRLVQITAADAAGGAQSLGELQALRLIRAAGLPEPTSQHVRRDANGRRRYLDLYWEAWGLHVEIDGAHHLDPRQAWLDADRHNQVWIEGERVLRFPVWVVRERPNEVVEDIRRALIAAGWRGDHGKFGRP
jgi:very-short-patch-repair endonuclease